MNTLPFNQKVLGLGLGRTGTKSLCEALNYLGIKTIHFPGPLTKADLISGNAHFAILNQYQGIANGTALPYRQIDGLYPGSKFILTIRDSKEWLESKKRLIAFVKENWASFSQMSRESKRLISENIYGSFEFDETGWLGSYEHHVEGVLEYFKYRQADLLVMNILLGEGWEKLCSFLGLPEPLEPFPNTNSIESMIEWQNRWKTLQADIESVIPAGASLIRVDDENFENEIFGDRQAIPFLEKNGIYWGLPQDDDTAIQELKRLHQSDVEFIVFTWPAFWWFDYYCGFIDYLEKQHPCILRNERVVIFDLRS
jgi:hypothetical protein